VLLEEGLEVNVSKSFAPSAHLRLKAALGARCVAADLYKPRAVSLLFVENHKEAAKCSAFSAKSLSSRAAEKWADALG
jgi:hypothetical protein